MADPFPPGVYSSIEGAASIGVQTVKPAYDKVLDFELRSMPLFRNATTEFKRVSDLTNPGSTVTFTLWNYKAAPATATTTNLDETDPVAPTIIPQGDVVSVTLEEFGDMVATTKLLRTFSFADVDSGAAAIVAAALADDVDLRVQTKLRGGTNVAYSKAGKASVTGADGGTGLVDGVLGTGDNFSTAIARYVRTKMNAASALPVGDGGEYLAFIHPDVEHDVRSETAAGGWREPHVHSAAGNIWSGSIGRYEGIEYVVTPRCYSDDDGAGATGGNGGDIVYRSYFMGKQALAEAVAVDPNTILADTYDPFRRHMGLGYYGIAGWGVYRQDCLWRVETTSTVSTTGIV